MVLLASYLLRLNMLHTLNLVLVYLQKKVDEQTFPGVTRMMKVNGTLLAACTHILLCVRH